MTMMTVQQKVHPVVEAALAGALEVEGVWAPNRWDGADLPADPESGKVSARLTVECGEVTLTSFDGWLVAWDVRFSTATPLAVIVAAVEAAL